MKDVPVVVLREYSYVRASLCRLHVPSSFHGGARVNTGHISPQSVTVVGGGARDGRTEPEQGARASPMFSGCQSAIRDELSPNVLEQKPWGHVQAGSVPSKCVLSPNNLTFTPH